DVDTQVLLEDMSQTLRQKYEIHHVTIQIERHAMNQPCNLI
ncbi:hypothetical protein Q604_UNBC07546G0002, partial [human gut metagenome]